MENNYLKMTRNLFLLVLLIEGCVGPPTQPKKNSTAPEEKEMTLDDLGLEYNRYLKEVVDTLESDKEFAQKLQSAKEVDFRNGKVAAELEFVSHHVRTKLDELKRTELQRLKELVAQLDEREHESKRDELHGHLDHTNPHTFEVADLHNLITKVRKDLDEADRLRKEEFKEYELQKEFEKQEKLKTLDEEHKKQYLHDLEEQKKKHEQHAPIHHPGGKAQLEEVWENVDHMENVKFDPRAFFKMHDIDSNGYWDEQEVAALFLKELEKMYEAGHPEDDLREREEEMERMREHVFKETDTNRDRLISLEEFIEQTKRQEYQRDDGWETIDQKPQFTQEEYLEFEKRRQAEIAEMQRRGLIPPYADGMGGYYQQHPGQVPPGQYGYPQYQHPNQMPQHPQMAQYPNQMPQHPGQMGQHPNQMPQHPNQMPQHPNQMPQHPNQMPQHPNQMPQHPNQMPQHPNQVPQHPNQVPQHPNQVPQHPNQMPQHPNQVPQHLNQVPQHPNQVPQHPNQVPQHPNQVPQQVPQHPNQMPQQSNQVPQQPNQMANNPNSQYNQVPQANQGYQVNEAAHQPVQNPPQQQFQQNQQYQQQNPQVPQQNQQYQQQNQQVPQQNQQPQGQYQKYEPHSNNVASNEKSANKV